MSADALQLPWNIQVALASGYAAYILCFAGIRAHHKAVDTTFSTLAFGLVATAVLFVLSPFKQPVWAGGAAFLATIIAGILWRKLGRGVLRAALRSGDVTWSNDDPSALATVSADSRHRVSQVAVLVDDGTWLRCDSTAKFEGAPFYPYVLGPSGDIALYLTHEDKPNGDSAELRSVRDAVHGDRVTYVPASRIKRITIRHVPINRPSKGALARLRSWWASF